MKAPSWPSQILAALLLVIGLAVGAGGGLLVFVGGSPYYLLGGIAVVLSGAGLWRSNGAAGWLYALFLAATGLWAIWEVGFDAWQLTARVIGPATFGLFFALPPVVRRIGPGGIAAGAAGLAGFLLVFSSSLLSQTEHVTSVPHHLAASPVPGNPGEWPSWGRDAAGTRFSPLTQITPQNVRKLALAWSFDTGENPLAAPVPSPLQATPLMVDGKLLLCTQNNVVFALDPDTGKKIWRFDPRVDPTGGSVVRTCRGVAYHDHGANEGTGCQRRVYTATFGAQLIALDSETGHPCEGFGNGGLVDLNAGMGRTPPRHVLCQLGAGDRARYRRGRRLRQGQCQHGRALRRDPGF